MLDLLRRAALGLLLVRVFLLTTAGEITSLKKHTAPRSTRGRRPQPWGLEARQIRRVGGRLVAFRLQLVIV